MPALEDKKREAFCQGVFKGLTKGKACMDAGFNVTKMSSASATATRLLKEEGVRARLAELSQQKEAEPAKYEEISETWVLSRLIQAFNAAKEQDKPQAMTAAMMGIAKMKGYIVDKKEVGAPGSFTDSMSDEELTEFIRTHAADVLPKLAARKAAASRTRH